MSDDLIIAELKKAGWQEADIQAGFMEVDALIPTVTNIQIPPQIFNQQIPTELAKPKIWKKVALALGIIVIVGGVSAGAYYTYNKFFTRGQDLWARAVTKTFSSPYMRVSVEGEISDVIPTDNTNSELDYLAEWFGTGRVAIGIKNIGDFKIDPGKQVDYGSVLTLSSKVGGFKMSIDFDIKKIGSDYYFKAGSNPLFSEFFDISGDKTPDWVKINLDTLREFIKEEKNNPYSFGEMEDLMKFSEFDFNEQIKELKKALLDVQPLKLGKKIGDENISLTSSEGTQVVKTWHYQTEFDKEGIKKYLDKVADIFKLKNDARGKELVIQVIDKVKPTIDIWIGQSDYLIYKININTKLPSVLSIMREMEKMQKRDGGRTANAEDIIKGLNKFYEQNGRYPNSLQEVPNQLYGTYYYKANESSLLLDAITPADSKCTDEENKYNYRVLNNGKDYSLRFCLGNEGYWYYSDVFKTNSDAATSGLQGLKNINLNVNLDEPVDLGSSDDNKIGPGIVEATSTGIRTVDTLKDRSGNVLWQNIINSAPLIGEFKITILMSDFSKKVEVTAPEKYKDLLGTLEEARIKSRDARRVADIKQIQTALEMTYADLRGYPVSATPVILGQGNFLTLGNTGFAANTSGFVTTYMKKVPSDPTPTISNYIYCSTAYKEPGKCANSNELYIITFQLEGGAGNLIAGKHVATPSGIDLFMPINRPQSSNIPSKDKEQQKVNISIKPNDYIRGLSNAPIKIIIFTDLECPYCKILHTTLQQLMENYGNKVGLVFRHFPMSFHTNAQKEAEAAECVGKLSGSDKFWSFIDRIFERTTSNGTGFALSGLSTLAVEIGVNKDQFNTCLNSGEFTAKIQADIHEGSSYGITGTPTIFINGQKVEGAVSYSQLKSVVDQGLDGN